MVYYNPYDPYAQHSLLPLGTGAEQGILQFRPAPFCKHGWNKKAELLGQVSEFFRQGPMILKRWFTKDLPRVNPADVQDLEWISQSLGFSLRS